MDDMAAAYYHKQPPPPPHHQPHYPYYPPPPPPGAAPPQPPLAHQYHHYPPTYGSAYDAPPLLLPPSSSRDEVRTLFIAGLPDDVKPREIYNLFRDFPGYESCKVQRSGRSSQAFAFAVFIDQQSAVTAMHALNGLIFDLEKETTLHIDLAKSNSRSKRQRSDDGFSPSGKKVRGSAGHSHDFSDSGLGSNIHMPGMGNSAHSTNGYPSTQSHMNYDYTLSYSDKTKNASSPPYVPQNNTPCPTLFVANLGPACSEHELTQVFSRCPGFIKLKMQKKRGAPVAFVDFQDEACSTGALNHLQGFLLHSSDGEGMRLEYAKSRMGLRKRERS